MDKTLKDILYSMFMEHSIAVRKSHDITVPITVRETAHDTIWYKYDVLIKAYDKDIEKAYKDGYNQAVKDSIEAMNKICK